MASKLPDKDMNDLKGKVLISRMDYLSAELGDPGRYFPALRAKGVLSPEDCERIKAKVTSSEKVCEMVELIRNRHSEKDGHAMDVLIEALRKQRVQAHIARELQRALARAKDQRKGISSDGLDASPLSTPSTATPANSQCSLGSIATPTSRLTTPSESAVSSPHQFEIHPQHGALPPLPPSKMAPLPPAQPSTDIDPRFGIRPGPPPPRHGVLHPTQEGTTPGVGEVTTGMSAPHLHSSVTGSFSSYHNGTDEESLDRRNSGVSYTTTSGTLYSAASTEQSGLDYGSGQGEEVGGQGECGRLQGMEGKYEDMLKRKEMDLAQMKRENTHLSTRLKEMEDRCDDLQKENAQFREKVKMYSISEQQHLLDGHKPGREDVSPDLAAHLSRQVQEKDQHITMLERQVEQYQRENQQLQLSLSGTGISRPHHLPISTIAGRPSVMQRQSHTPVRSPFQVGGGETSAVQVGTPSTGITPMKSYRVGDSLNQHNIHLQQSWGSAPGSRRDSPALSPGKDPSSKGPGMFSPGRESGGAKTGLFSPGSGKRLSGGSGDTPMGESYFQSSSSSLNSSESKGSAGVTLQTAPNAEQHSTMV